MSMDKQKTVAFTIAELEAIFGEIDSLSGWNAENVFAWDGTDDPNEPVFSAMAKIFRAAGRRVPKELEGVAGS